MFFNSRKGQVRGIDFSISMILFLLIVSQFVVLTNNFITSNRAFLTSQDRLEFGNSVLDDVLYSTGNLQSADWTTRSTAAINSAILSNNFELGLNTNGEVDPFKLSRLSNWTSTNMFLDYNTIAAGLELENKDFQMEFYSSLNVNITSTTATVLTAFEVNGTLDISGSNIENGYIQIFVLGKTASTIVESSGYSSSIGEFSITFDASALATNDFVSVVALASYGETVQSIDHKLVQVGTATRPTTTTLSVSPANTHASGYSVNYTASQSAGGNTALVTALYKGSFGTSNFTQSTTYTDTDFQVPDNGMVVFIVQEINAGSIVNFAVLSMPIILDGNLGSPITPTGSTSAISTIVSTVFEVRGILMNFLLTIWE